MKAFFWGGDDSALGGVPPMVWLICWIVLWPLDNYQESVRQLTAKRLVSLFFVTSSPNKEEQILYPNPS